MAVATRQIELTEAVARPGQRRRRFLQLGLHVGLALWAFQAIFPLFWIFITSLKYTPELYANPFALPQHWKWSNYQEAWVYAKMGRYFLNSVAVTLGSTVLVLFLASTTAYVLA